MGIINDTRNAMENFGVFRSSIVVFLDIASIDDQTGPFRLGETWAAGNITVTKNV